MQKSAAPAWPRLVLHLIALHVIALAALLMPQAASAQPPARDSMELSLELVDPKVLRVCADPHNLPFSNEKGEGFENKLAELFAAKLDKSLAYTWFPQATGFVRQTLGSHRCDVIMGFPQGDDLVQATNPYYRTAYAFIFKPGSDLEGIDTIADERLKTKRIGIVAGTPAATYLAVNSLLARVKPYALMVDTRIDSSAEAMVRDLKAGDIDIGILWGPMAGYYAKQETPPLRVVPLIKETGGPRLVYRITMGVRGADQAWKRQLSRLIQENQLQINKLLIGFGVPLLDEKDQPITENMLTKKP
jgi:quinoprotein dehydrogenase-associated probable ABC transporter substrate-binding protein